MMEDHCESISVPSGFVLVASSDACVNEMMQHQTRPFFGVQFHPESILTPEGKKILQNFILLTKVKQTNALVC
jgi:GMP synthase-like glutamine amidotransferase